MRSENIVCCRCGEVVPNRRLFAQVHAKLHSSSPLEQEKIIVDSIYGESKVNQLVQDYKDGNICIFQMQPIDIAKYLCLLGIKRSSSEERQTDRYKRQYLSSIQHKYGAGITNISQVMEVQKKKEKTFSEKYGSYDAYLAQCREKMGEGYTEYRKDNQRVSNMKKVSIQTFRSRYGVDNAARIERARNSISKKAKTRMAAKTAEERTAATYKARIAVPHHWAKTTKLEQIILDGLKRLSIAYKIHQRVGRYSIDIVIGSIAIEVNGDVYHANPRIYKATDEVLKGMIAERVWERDARKKKAIEEAGYELVILWEDEIRKNKNRIESFIKTKLNHKKERQTNV